MTVNQIHFERNEEFIKDLIEKKLIWGLGISLRDATPQFVKRVKRYPNAVIHVINGLFRVKDAEILGGNNLKLLILGYKHLRRGIGWYEKNQSMIRAHQLWLREMLPSILERFKVVSFDNLAIEQLDVRRLLDDDEWEEFFMGQDGNFTYYLDLVEGKFGKNSLATERFPIMDSADDMFQKIRSLTS